MAMAPAAVGWRLEPEPEQPEPQLGPPLALRQARASQSSRTSDRAAAKAAAGGPPLRSDAAVEAGSTSSGGGTAMKLAGGASGAGLSPMAAFVRVKPLDVEPGGGTASSKRITHWDESAGTIEMDVAGGVEGHGRSGAKNFDYAVEIIGPESTQKRVYDSVAAPLVAQFVQGYDVDLISYGQTGSGKTFTMFGPPHSMAQADAAQRKSGAGKGISGDGILRPEHGFVLRSGLDCLAALQELAARGCKAVLHGSMIEMSILSFQEQNCMDLLKDYTVCFVDDEYHLQGTEHMELRCAADVVQLAAAVETRLTRGTKMNDTSSRSHCVATLKLTVLEGGAVRTSRLQFFDLMGSERFVGQNAAHDTSQSSKSTHSGWEGIFSNLSLMCLYSCIELAAKNRRKKNPKPDKSMIGMLLTKLLAGSLMGSALTGMITCVSQSPRNGDETYSSLGYGTTMSKLLNKAKPQPAKPIEKLLATAHRKHAEAAAVVARGVAGKYQAARQAQVKAHAHDLSTLEALMALQ
jgi:kinesin family protein 5